MTICSKHVRERTPKLDLSKPIIRRDGEELKIIDTKESSILAYNGVGLEKFTLIGYGEPMGSNFDLVNVGEEKVDRGSCDCKLDLS